MVYFVAKDVARIDASLTTTVTREIKECSEKPDADEKDQCEKGRGFRVAQASQYDRDIKGTLVTLADTSQPFVLDLEPGGAADSSLRVKVRPNGLLESVNADSTGKAGEAIVGLGRLLGSFAGAVSGLPLGAGTPPAPETQSKMTNCDAKTTSGLLPLRARALVATSQPACDVWLRAKTTRRELERLRGERTAQEAALAAATGTALKEARKKLAATREGIADREQELTALETRFAAQLDAFVRSLGLGKVTRTQANVAYLELADLPKLDEVPAGLGPEGVAKALTAPKAQMAFHQTCAVVAVDASASGSAPVGAERLPCRSDNRTNKACKDRAYIFYRGSRPVRLALLGFSGVQNCATPTSTEANEKLAIVSDQILDVVDPRAPLGHVAFKGSAFAARKLALTFDEKGRPLALERSGTSDSAAVSTALADTLKASRQEFAETLKTLATAAEDRTRLRLSGLTEQVEELKKRKQILDAKLDLEGVSTTFADVLQRRQLDAEVATLQGEIALAGAEATAAQNVEIVKLKAEVERLRQELELLKVLRDLDTARGGQ